MDVRTVRKWLAEKQFHPRTGHRGKQADPFKNDIVRMLEAHPYSAMQIFSASVSRALTAGIPSSRNMCARSGRQNPRLSHTRPLPRASVPRSTGAHMALSMSEPPAEAQLLCHGALLQPHDVCGVHRLADHGAFFGLPSKRFRVLRFGSPKNHGR